MMQAVQPTPTSNASAWIAILQDEDDSLVSAACQQLLRTVDSVWHQIAPALPDLEARAENGDQTAAAVASRVLFYLQEPKQALRVALLAGPVPADGDPYTERLTAAALDCYVEQKKGEKDDIGIKLEDLEKLVFSMLDRACATGNHKHALGMALEAQHVPKLREILQLMKPDEWKMARKMIVSTVAVTSLRSQAFAALAECWEQHVTHNSDALSSSAAERVILYQHLDQAAHVASLLAKLPLVEALQIAWDIADASDLPFCKGIVDASPQLPDQVVRVLTGGMPSELFVSLLYSHSHADIAIMDNLKKALEERGSRALVLHNAAVMSHSFLYAGTTNDSFLRNHLDWMKKASNWAKFSATASLGVVHAGHVSEAMHLLQPYLPESEGNNSSTTIPGYSEGGSLYALGLIHGGTGVDVAKCKDAADYIRTQLRSWIHNEVIAHGACLGVGLTMMGSADLEAVRELKEVLDTDSAVAGEAAGIALGMVLVGAGSPQQPELAEIVSEVKNYARETQHEKIIRGIAVGLALMQYGLEEGADATIEEMRNDRDPIMRYGAQYATALAYAGTGSNKAIQILLHTAVSDVSDDVRMAAVIGLALVLFQTPERVPQLVSLLLESFNPHVRYASCMAVGIAMAGTGDAESIALLEPMLDDMTDYVRQGALLGTALIYMQCTNDRKLRAFRDKLSTVVSEKHQSSLTKMGAIVAQGIIDAGGRNCAIQLASRTGFPKRTSIVGLTLWLQHWHWFPMMQMFQLALTPTFTIGLNSEFKYPKNFEIICNSKPSQFAYPKKLQEKKEEKKKRVETVTLSITAKEKARLARKRAKLGLDDSTPMDTNDGEKKKENEENEKDKKDDEPMEVDGEDGKEPAKKTKKKREPEPTVFRVSNPSRVTKSQGPVCEFDLTQRYRPINPSERVPMGIIMLIDSSPDKPEEEELEEVKSPMDEPEGELPPPKPFKWTPPAPGVQEDAAMEDAAESKE